MERDPFERDQGGGSDVGRDFERDYGDEPAPAFRDAAPDFLAPIDDSAPVSGTMMPSRPAASAGSNGPRPSQAWRSQAMICSAWAACRWGPISAATSAATSRSKVADQCRP